jgi:hypothetical protein
MIEPQHEVRVCTTSVLRLVDDGADCRKYDAMIELRVQCALMFFCSFACTNIACNFLEAPTITPETSRKGEIVSEMSTKVPSLRPTQSAVNHSSRRDTVTRRRGPTTDQLLRLGRDILALFQSPQS